MAPLAQSIMVQGAVSFFYGPVAFWHGQSSGMDTKKKKPGRLKLPKGERRASVVTVRMSKAERNMIGDAADAADVKLSEWIRATLIVAANHTIDSMSQTHRVHKTAK